jgi:uncharacterized protein (TIGR02646 family)
MRALVKGAIPKILEDNAVSWTAELLAAIASEDDPTKTQKNRYNKPEIKQAILDETLGKCAYCESKITHIDDGDIEHLVPKSKVAERSFDWSNLTLACTQCNRNKGAFHGGDNDHSGLVDPYQDNPTDHFMFLREIVLPRPDSNKAVITESIIKLARSELVECRKERMEFIDGLLLSYHNAPDDLKPIIKADIIKKSTSEGSEYTGIGREYISFLEHKRVF